MKREWRRLLRKGTVLRDNRVGGRLHIRGRIDREYIVYKWWNSNKQHWKYEVKHEYMVELWFEEPGRITVIKRVP